MSTDQQPTSSTPPANTHTVPDINSQPQPQPDSSTSQDHQQKEEALAAFTATLHSVGTTLELPLRSRAALIESNAAALERQEAELAGHTAQLAKQNEQWAGLAEDARKGLKEIGDVQNWAELIERDLLVLEEMVDVVERRQDEEDEEDEEMEMEMETGSEHGHGDGERRVNGINTMVAHEEDPKKRKDERKRGWWAWW
ncbi:uncharacterized protein PFLUO_LOCUS2382 [Penicillium psychrofluorescens]|uniref:uncharacterized protein n=1 Tax=Penicillium psychrofluorescens TaxID=3158075 RepID=UPI003CCCC8B0